MVSFKKARVCSSSLSVDGVVVLGQWKKMPGMGQVLEEIRRKE